jgi:uncharacterized membrane protein YpjA
VLREKGTWAYVGLTLIFGHFFLPFLLLLRIDMKLKLPVMGFIFIWAWLMHFIDLSFNIMPVLHPDGFVLHWLDVACLAFIGGVLATVFLKFLNSHPAFPRKDPRFAEALNVYIPPATAPVEPLPAASESK